MLNEDEVELERIEIHQRKTDYADEVDDDEHMYIVVEIDVDELELIDNDIIDEILVIDMLLDDEVELDKPDENDVL